MKVLVIGSGAREHAIAHALMRGGSVSEVTVAPGNPGMELDGIRITQINPSNHAALIDFVKNNGYDWVFVGPEVPLIEGIVDDFAQAGIKAFGPSKAAAQIEGSKDFAKQLMERHSIPTAKYQTFGDLERSTTYVREHGAPIVIKADGLAAGKGVLIVPSLEEAKRELGEMLSGRFGHAGDTVVIEEYLSGIECSVFVATDGKSYRVLPVAKDYKRVGEGDTGPNTGGMGAVSPVPFADEAFMGEVIRTIVEPTVEGLRKDGIDYKGFIFIGLMNVGGKPYVIEYNVRMGDPETEVVFPRIESDLIDLFEAIAFGRLDRHELVVSPRTAVTVVCVSGGYPGEYAKGMEISGLGKPSDSIVFHAGTSAKGAKVLTAGGRVLAVPSFGDGIEPAAAASYRTIETIDYQGKYCRTDIGRDLL